MSTIPRETLKVAPVESWRNPRFHEIGDTFTGLLLGTPVTQQMTVYGGTDKAWWDAEETRPRMEHIYKFLLVSESPHAKSCHYCKKMKERTDEDGGGRKLFASDKQHYTIQAAFRDVENPELYGPLTFTYSADDKSKQKAGYDAPKVWVATYRNPTDEEVALCDKFLGVTTNDKSQEAIAQEFESLLEFEPPTKRLTLADMQALAQED